MKFNFKKQFGMIKLLDDEGAPIATFTDDDHGRRAFGYMAEGMARVRASEDTLFDLDTNQTQVGDIGTMIDEDRAGYLADVGMAAG